MNCGTKSRAWCNYKVVGGSERGALVRDGESVVNEEGEHESEI